jgi:predicted  nucleic acid-binding Zn-ribbon protein
MSDQDSDEVTELRESLPDDLDERAGELKQRSENRDLTDAEKQIVGEDIKQLAEAMQPVMRKISHLMPELASELGSELQRRNDK